jgi:hypothetical protein
MFEQEQRPEAYLGRWFLSSGVVGMGVAAILTGLMIHDLVPTRLALALWPSSIVGLVDPHTLTDKLYTMAFTFGGQFLLYGLGGLLLGYGINVMRTFISRR